jgi:hypothetical protein
MAPLRFKIAHRGAPYPLLTAKYNTGAGADP